MINIKNSVIDYHRLGPLELYYVREKPINTLWQEDSVRRRQIDRFIYFPICHILGGIKLCVGGEMNNEKH